MQIPLIPSGAQFMDLAVNASKRSAKQLQGNLTGETRLKKSITIESQKINAIQGAISKQLNLVTEKYPSLETLPEYQKELLYTSLDYQALKKSLGAVVWAKKKVTDLTREHLKTISRIKKLDQVNVIRRAYFGRVGSVIKQITDHLALLERSRKVLNDFPQLNLEQPIVCIVGFPNVGKSTLLNKLTPSKVQVADYAFTTKSLNAGTYTRRMNTIQFVDAPGTLNREKMNAIEQQADVAMRFLANYLVFVFDPTDTYSVEEQLALYEAAKTYHKPIMLYMSKKDIATKEQVARLKKTKLEFIDDAEEMLSTVYDTVYPNHRRAK